MAMGSPRDFSMCLWHFDLNLFCSCWSSFFFWCFLHDAKNSKSIRVGWLSFPSIRPGIYPSKFLIPEEKDDGGLHSVRRSWVPTSII